MKKSKADNEGYYAISGYVSVAIVLILHYLFIARINMHSTIHVAIGIFIFFLLSSIITAILKKVWW